MTPSVPRGTMGRLCGNTIVSSRWAGWRGHLRAYQEQTSQGMGYRDRLAPLPSADLLNFGEVASPNPKNNLFRCYLFRPRPIEKAWEFTERARTNVIEGGNLLPKLF